MKAYADRIRGFLSGRCPIGIGITWPRCLLLPKRGRRSLTVPPPRSSFY